MSAAAQSSRMPAKGFIAPRDGLSHVAGDRSAPLDERTIPQLLADAVAEHGGREAAVFAGQGRRFSWDDLGREVEQPTGDRAHQRGGEQRAGAVGGAGEGVQARALDRAERADQRDVGQGEPRPPDFGTAQSHSRHLS